MSVSYNRLWKLLIDKSMKKMKVRNDTGEDTYETGRSEICSRNENHCSW